MSDTVSLDAWKDRIGELGAGEFSRRLRLRLLSLSFEMAGTAKRNARQRPEVRSGRLWNSIRSTVEDTEEGGFALTLKAGGRVSGGEVVYAAAQEFGATVRPRASDYLRIPLGPALTGAGVDRFGGSLRSYPGEGFFPFRSSRGGLFIGKKGDEIGDGAPRAWYALVREVKVPRTLFLGRAVEEAVGKMKPELADVWRVALRFDRDGEDEKAA